MIVLDNREENIKPFLFSKRLFDIFFALISIIASSPLWALIIVAMSIENIARPQSRGRIFYQEKRISAGKSFPLLKFRIIKQSALSSALTKENIFFVKQLEWDKKNLTTVGRLIKKWYLDELPQLFNVLVGQMTIVGPRPVNETVYQRLLEQGYVAKKLLRAGLTGNYQSYKGIAGYTDKALDDQYLNFYLGHSWFKILIKDMTIIVRTIGVVLRAEGI